MKEYLIAAVVLIAGLQNLSSCGTRIPILLLNRELSLESGKFECRGDAALKDLCEQSVAADLGRYMTSAEAAFMDDSECHGIRLIEGAWFRGEESPEETNVDWRLSIDIGHAGQEEPTYTWSLSTASKPYILVSGPINGESTATPKNTMHSVCRILKNTGGVLAKS